jgi:hypothetical protein
MEAAISNTKESPGKDTIILGKKMPSMAISNFKEGSHSERRLFDSHPHKRGVSEMHRTEI